MSRTYDALITSNEYEEQLYNKMICALSAGTDQEFHAVGQYKFIDKLREWYDYKQQQNEFFGIEEIPF